MTDEKMDFGAMLAQFEKGHTSRTTTRIEAGKKVSGKITRIGAETVFVDVNAPADALMDKVEFLDEAGLCMVKVGDSVEGICIHADEDGEIRLTKRVNAATADSALSEAFQARIPVEGRVVSETKGGFEVTIGSHRGFCPYSQIDLGKMDAALYLGQKLLFLIQEYSENGRRLVVNRRRLLEQEQGKLLEELKTRIKSGDRLEGTVKKIMPFGVFVDIGGTDGLVPLSELAWKRDVKAEDVVTPGQKVQVVVRDIDWERKRISLSLRAAAADPWDGAGMTYVAGSRHFGTVVKTLDFGAFVELEPGVEGLIPISKLGRGRRLNHAGEAVKEGDPLEVLVENFDAEKHRISLSVVSINSEEAAAAAEQARQNAAVVPGAVLDGIVDALKEFGAFIKFPGGRSGLLHISRMGLAEGPGRLRQMHGAFGSGKEVKVEVVSVDGDRVSLSVPGVQAKVSEEEAEDEAYTEYQRNLHPGSSLGNLGKVLGALDNLKLD